MADEVKELVDNVRKEKNDAVKEERKDLVSRANDAAERLEKANTELKALLDKQEVMNANSRLGGRSFAGEVLKEKTQEEKERAEAMKLLEGTGLNPFR